MPGLGASSHPGATLSATCPGGVVLQRGTSRPGAVQARVGSAVQRESTVTGRPRHSP
jgi:hypothetical protein